MNKRKEYFSKKITNRTIDTLLKINSLINSTSQKKCMVYGNCQARPLARLLSVDKNFSKKYQIINYKPVYTIEGKDLYHLEKICKKIDLFIYQPIKTGYLDLYEIGTDFLKSLLTKDSISISFHSLYFDAYNPECIYIKRTDSEGVHQGPFGDYHNEILIQLYIDKLNYRDTVQYLRASKAKDPSSIEKNLDQSINELFRREQTKNIDIKIAQYIKDNYQQKRLFWTFNHPSNDILIHCSQEIIKRLGMNYSANFCKKKITSYELLDMTCFSIHPSIYETLNLSFNNPDVYYYKGQTFELNEVVKMFYIYYDNHPEVIEAYQENIFR